VRSGDQRANAVAAAARHHPDLMIVDVGLGEASGVAAVKEILRSGFVPHVFATGDALRDLSLGPNRVLIQKPFRGRTSFIAIERALAAKPTGAVRVSGCVRTRLVAKTAGHRGDDARGAIGAISRMSRALP